MGTPDLLAARLYAYWNKRVMEGEGQMKSGVGGPLHGRLQPLASPPRFLKHFLSAGARPAGPAAEDGGWLLSG